MRSRRSPARGRSRRPPLSEVFTYRIRVELLDVTPKIWRLVEVPSTLTLEALHSVLQTAMGWTDSHLHRFTLGNPRTDWPVESFLTAFDIEEGDEGAAEADVRLDEVMQQPGDELGYTYDLGDDWDHVVRLESARPRAADDPPAALLDGRRACPPEDCGGAPGYDELLALLARAARGERLDPDERQQLEWLCDDQAPADVLAETKRLDVAAIDAELRAGRAGSVPAADLDDLDSFDVASAVLATGAVPVVVPLPARLADLVGRCDLPGRRRLLELIASARLDEPVDVDAATAATMVAPFAWFVRHIGLAGQPLTSQGYLKPVDVSAVCEHLHLGDEWIGTMNRESLTPPVSEFRRAAREAGLVRVAKGRIHATARGMTLADDPVGLWQHLADRMPVGRRDDERDAGNLVLLMTAAGCDGNNDLGPLMTSVGWRVGSDEPI
ncbi:MAG: plasmid pRiA4b ORF-3 family protein, partial [Micrococcales bacterium]|nr:plasmid pRiA4b ORF-3 family protein [Micrococcales bacterium]